MKFTNTSHSTSDPLPPVTLGAALVSAAQNGILKHAGHTGVLPRSVRGAFRVRIDGRTTEYVLSIKAVGGAS